MNNLTFGIELETIVPDNLEDKFPRGGYHHGETLPLLPEGWEGRWDRSIVNEPGTYSLEIVSPVLSGESGFNEVSSVLSILNEYNIRTNASCGFHVHVGAETMTKAHVKTIKQMFTHFETAFFGQCGSQAVERLLGRGWEYCKTAPAWGGDMDRRQSLNTSNWANGDAHKNTIEVRCFAGTLEQHRVLGGILMTMTLVARAMSLSSAMQKPMGIFTEVIGQPDKAMEMFINLHFRPRYLPISVNHRALPIIITGLKREAALATQGMIDIVESGGARLVD